MSRVEELKGKEKMAYLSCGRARCGKGGPAGHAGAVLIGLEDGRDTGSGQPRDGGALRLADR